MDAGQDRRDSRSRRCFAISAALCTLVFVWLISDGTFKLLFPEQYGSFYDYQAQSLLKHRLDVPIEAISGEAYIVQGKNYGYFGIMPAVLRLPLTAMHVGFGELTRAFMIGYYIAILAAAYGILCHFTRLVRGTSARPSCSAVALMTFNVGLGSAVLFLGSRAFLYHEAIISGIAFAAWSAYFSLRYLVAPGWRWAAWALLTGLCAVHCRPTAGLFSLGFIGACAAVQGLKRSNRREIIRLHLPVALLSAVAFLSANYVSYLKFGTFDEMPQRYSLQFRMNPNRLRTIEGKNFHLCNLHINAAAYLYSFNFVKMARFPYFHQMWESASYFPECKMDMCEECVGIPYSMPVLTVLAVLGAVGVVRRTAIRWPLAIAIAAFLPVAGALLTAVADSHRYTGDFVPFLIVAGSGGLALADQRGRPWLRYVLGALTCAALAVNFDLALYYQGVRPGATTTDGVRNYERVAHFFK